MKKLEPPPIATGPGPRWVRRGLVVVALVYFAALLKHPPSWRWLQPASFFTEATSLFPRSNEVVLEYRLEAWVCGRDWAPLDPRPYFPIQPDDKESRFQRLGYFYFNDRNLTARDRKVGIALDQYISARHAEGVDDGVTGRIGGIRVFKVTRHFPMPGEPVERYHYDPLGPVLDTERKDKYTTPDAERAQRCQSS